jgi:hypothetical protein
VTAIDLPARLDWLRDEPAGRRWLEVLPQWLDRCVRRWSLRLGERYDGGMCSLAVPATLPDGTAAVLKLQAPDRESEHEADALRVWAGDGAVRLLDADREVRALLLERCDPGAPLSSVAPERALGVFVDLLPRLWRPAGAPPGRRVGPLPPAGAAPVGPAHRRVGRRPGAGPGLGRRADPGVGVRGWCGDPRARGGRRMAARTRPLSPREPTDQPKARSRTVSRLKTRGATGRP